MPLAPVRRVLPNGVTVVAQANRLIPAVSLAIGVKAGAILDPPGAEGTAALTARVLDKGTTRYDRDAIADELEGRGASLSVGASRLQTTVSATCLVEDFSAVLPVSCAVARTPTFPDTEVAIRRGELLTTIREGDDDPGTVAELALIATLYPSGHPLGRPARGTAGTAGSLTRSDLATFHGRWFQPSVTTVMAVGDIDPQAVVDQIAEELDEWRGSTVASPAPGPPPPITSRHVVSRPMPDKSQADIAYGFVGLARSDPDYYAALVMNNALGQYGLGGRLGDSIRERQGMAYYVYSSLDAGVTAGPLLVRAGVSGDNVDRTIASIDAELQSILSDGFTRAEVDDSKLYLIGSLPRQLETNAGIAGFLLSTELFGLGIDHDVRLPARIEAVSYDDVMRAARRLLDPARAVVVVAGPWTGSRA